MDTVFQKYATYYDLLNREKDYEGEIDYLLALHGRYSSTIPNQILNLGCGTGLHDLNLARRGYQILGVDRSETMLAMAAAAAINAPDPQPQFLQADITELNLTKSFDLVISLFHVISYQTATRDLLATFSTAASHLPPTGLFLFDFWFGPAVLHQKPEVRIKRAEDTSYRIRRITEPVLHVDRNTVDVNFEVEVFDKATTATETLRETHTMRYLFLPEIEDLLHRAGLSLLTAEEWLSGKQPDLNTWNVCCVAQKKP
ncbi:MAG: class I SAM-dependent methyltransferase [Proteobacteria bacterium]|nr:class I SAM-dependent methyltransferase [Pseudomonadota bacterium]MBU1686725.1 class I SAM-dependent methyltransferase [Pseudomonadota bacterium]